MPVTDDEEEMFFLCEHCAKRIARLADQKLIAIYDTPQI
jgi:hypothetical protein